MRLLRLTKPFLRRALGAAHFAWVSLGVLLVILIAAEVSSSLVLTALAARAPTIDARTRSDALASEDWAESYFREFQSSSDLRWEPFSYWRRASFHGAYINVNDAGIRSTWQPPPQPESVTIWMFGGSNLWGTGARDDQTIPSQLARQLAERAGISARITNYGETGYVSTQSLVLLERELQRGKRPDLVIFYDGTQDTFAALQQGVAGVTSNEFNREREFNLLQPSRRPDVVGLLLGAESIRNTATVRLATLVVDRLAGRRGGAAGSTAEVADPEALARDVTAVYRENVRMVEQLGRAYGFDSRFYWQPVLLTKAPHTEYERTKAAEVAYALAHYEAVYGAIGADPVLAADLRFADISDLFANEPRGIFLDLGHTSEAGNAIVVERMLPDVIAALRVR